MKTNTAEAVQVTPRYQAVFYDGGRGPCNGGWADELPTGYEETKPGVFENPECPFGDGGAVFLRVGGAAYEHDE